MKFNNILIIITLLFALYSCKNLDRTPVILEQQNDSITVLLKKSYDKSLTNQQKINTLERAYKEIATIPSDSIKTSQFNSIAYRFSQLKDTLNFFKVNAEALDLAIKRRDSFAIGDAHWSYADYYLTEEVFDKAFYHFSKALRFFNSLNKEYQSARMIYSMAYIKGRYKDYTGSEVLNIEAIKRFKKLGNNKYLYLSYNHLALIHKDIKEYDLALEYFEEARNYLVKLKKKENYQIWNLNNVGNIFFEKEEYQKAIKNYSLALTQFPQKKDYAMILDNLYYCKLLMRDTIGVKDSLLKSLKIRSNIEDKAGTLTSQIRISEFYEYKGDTLNAIIFAKKANMLAIKIKNGGDYLTTLKQLADLQPEKANEYLKLYARFSDSLTNAERKTLNKFTRIEFETDEIIEKNEILTQQRIWIFSASIALILILSLLYFIRVQRVKNEKLLLETEQQKANEQVYLLTLKQQATLEEEKARERNRISQELHDGILGRLFGTRVGLGFLDLNADEKTQEQHEAFLDELQDIEKEIREVSHKLNDNFDDPDVNFTSIVTQLLESKSQIGDFQFHLSIDENISWKSTDEIIKVNVYRIIQETLQNTIKHAQAKNVILEFSSNENELTVLIQDDGVGFNMKKSKKGIGLKNMRSRVEKLNGTLEIASAMNKGTQIHIKIPIV